MDEEKFVLIDADAGKDDALAIFMCLQAHRCLNRKFKVVGITCVKGNTQIDNVTRNVTRILNQVGLGNEIPVYRGSEVPILFPLVNKAAEEENFHGLDGFGDVYPPIEPNLQAENGVLAMIRLAHEYKGRLTILALASLTNLAMAIRLDPTMKDCVREIYAMGGNIEGVGNVTVSGEFNFVVDPEAAFITLNNYTCPIYIVPWEVCLRQGMRPMKWRREELGSVKSPEVELLNAIEGTLLAGNAEGWLPADQVAAAVLLDNDVIKKSVEYFCTVELHGMHTRGLMVVDYPSVLNQQKNVTVIAEIHAEVMEKVFIWGAGGPDYKRHDAS